MVTVQDGTSSCPAVSDKKHRRFLRCEIWWEKPLTNKLDMAFPTKFPAVLNSCTKWKKREGKQYDQC